VLITVFYFLLTNIIIYQYNTAIFENLLQNDIKGFEDSAVYYLGLADEERIVQEVERFRRRRPRFLNLAFFKETDGRLEAFFTYPENLVQGAHLTSRWPLSKRVLQGRRRLVPRRAGAPGRIRC
jgi:hypothetical protein